MGLGLGLTLCGGSARWALSGEGDGGGGARVGVARGGAGVVAVGGGSSVGELSALWLDGEGGEPRGPRGGLIRVQGSVAVPVAVPASDPASVAVPVPVVVPVADSDSDSDSTGMPEALPGAGLGSEVVSFAGEGLTLERAVGLVLEGNPELLALRQEIPLARADLLTAGLLPNPRLTGDVTLIPYQMFDERRPGGQTQYDVRIAQPLDVSGKRLARVAVAEAARDVAEARYQDGARLAIEATALAFVEALAARETSRLVSEQESALRRALEVTRSLYEQGLAPRTDVQRVEVQLGAAEVLSRQASEALSAAKRELARLTNLPIGGSEDWELSGTLELPRGDLPELEGLWSLAMASRPDLAAARFSLDRARAERRLALANRLDNLELTYTPFTYQDNAPFGTLSARSWGLALTVPVPLFDRNQGNIWRAEASADQALLTLRGLERRVEREVAQARRDVEVGWTQVERLRRVVEAGERVRDDTVELVARGESDALAFLNAQRDLNDVLRQYRDAQAELRRAAARLNSATAARILP